MFGWYQRDCSSSSKGDRRSVRQVRQTPVRIARPSGYEQFLHDRSQELFVDEQARTLDGRRARLHNQPPIPPAAAFGTYVSIVSTSVPLNRAIIIFQKLAQVTEE